MELPKPSLGCICEYDSGVTVATQIGRAAMIFGTTPRISKGVDELPRIILDNGRPGSRWWDDQVSAGVLS